MVAAGATAWLAKRWLDVQAAHAPVEQRVATHEVLVVARDVTMGTVLGEEDLRYDQWPVSVPADRFVVRKDGDDPKKQYVGQVARRALAEGEPFSPASTFKQDAAGLLAGVLSPGMRAVSVAITSASAVSGFIVPGDRVDVVLAADFQRTDSQVTSKGGPIVRYAAETVLEDVKVLAVDQQMAKGKDGGAIQGKTATLEVTPKQAEVLTTVGMLGQLSLVLRGQTVESKPEPVSPYTSDTESSRALKAVMGAKPKAAQGGGTGVIINRAGAVSSKGF
jgi:pilus assembly protein CpaB